MSVRVVRNREEYWQARTARKRYRCESNRQGCAELIEPGTRYIAMKLPPDSEIGNEGWWHMRICVPCAAMYHSHLFEQLGLPLPEGATR